MPIQHQTITAGTLYQVLRVESLKMDQSESFIKTKKLESVENGNSNHRLIRASLFAHEVRLRF